MIPFNPCGMAVDWGRRPYTTTARLFNTPDAPLVRIRWYVTDQPFQEFPSFVNSLDWDEEPHRPRVLGEVYGTPRTYNGLWRMPGLPGGHQCGEPSQFLEGVPYDPDREPVALDRDWIPTCCNRRPVGEAVVGILGGGELHAVPLYVGSALVGVNASGSMQRVATESGSAVVGVTAAGELQRIATEEGSAVVGITAAGEMEVVVGGVVPGDDCSTAGVIGEGGTHGADITGSGTEQWWRLPGLTIGSTYHVSYTGLGGIGQPTLTLLRGDTCGGATPVSSFGFGSCRTFTMGAGANLYVKITGTAGTHTYTFTVSGGACP